MRNEMVSGGFHATRITVKVVVLAEMVHAE